MIHESVKKNYKKDCLLQNLKIVLLGVLVLLLAVLTVLELFTAGMSEVGVDEPVRTSSSLINVGQGRYTSTVSGRLVNRGDDTVRIELVTVTVSDGKESRKIEIEGFVLPPHFERDIFAEWQGTKDYHTVTRVAVTVNGVEDVIPNTEETMPVSGIAILYFALLVLSALFLVRACKIRYYIYQEMQVQK